MARYLGDAWAIPAIDDLNRAFFTSGKLLLQQCASCGTVQHPPEDVCHRCRGMDFRHVEAAGTGTVHSHATMHYPVHPALAERVPYVVVLVELDDYPAIRVLGNCVNVEPQQVRIGMPVRAVFETVEDAEAGETLAIPQWEAAGA